MEAVVGWSYNRTANSQWYFSVVRRVHKTETSQKYIKNSSASTSKYIKKYSQEKNTIAKKWFRAEPLSTSSFKWQLTFIASFDDFTRPLYNTD